MVGVRFTTSEVQRLLDGLTDGKVGPADDPEVVAIQRKLTVMQQVAVAVEMRPRPRESGDSHLR